MQDRIGLFHSPIWDSQQLKDNAVDFEVKAAPKHPNTLSFLSDVHKKNLIGNQWIPAKSGQEIESIDPATGERIAFIPESGTIDVDDAVNAAQRAFHSPEWRALTPSERGRLLWRLAELIETNIESLAELETLDQGKPVNVARWAEIPGAVEQFRFFAGEASKIEGSTIPSSINYQPKDKTVFAYTRKEPIGVVGAIVPWNSPIVLTAMKLAPALAAGCTLVLKPAEDTSLTALRLGELIIEAGFPKGVVNIVTGFGEAAGHALASHPGVNKVAFTGSTETGRKILDAAKENLKKVSLELGGKSPVIVFKDAELDAAIQGAANAIFFNGGQVCVAGSRLYVERGIFEAVTRGICKIAEGLKLGHGLHPETSMGPLVNADHANKVRSFIKRAEQQGAKILTGGNGKGSFVEPTVLTDVTPEMEIVCEEVFGPVLVCIPFDSMEDVLSQANESRYGLAASVWTENLSKAHRVAEALEAGTVWINSHAVYDASLPIGGMKQSGWGRDSGRQAIDNYIEEKTVCAFV